MDKYFPTKKTQTPVYQQSEKSKNKYFSLKKKTVKINN